MDKPHQHLFVWDAHMVKAQNTIIHVVICTAAKHQGLHRKLKLPFISQVNNPEYLNQK
jgi:hypothetical protein